MSPETYLWVRAVHIFGILMWVGTMFGLYQTAFAYGKAGGAAREPLMSLMRRTAISMDIGALIAIASGVALILGSPLAPMKQGWMHVKLTVVVVGLLGLHIYGRIKLRKMRQDGANPPPNALFGVLIGVVVGIIILAVVRPL